MQFSEELSQLNAVEKERSSDINDNLIKFRKVLIQYLFNGVRTFLEQIVLVYKGELHFFIFLFFLFNIQRQKYFLFFVRSFIYLLFVDHNLIGFLFSSFY